MRWRLLETHKVPFKGPTHRLTQTGSELQRWDSSLKSTRDIWGRTELSASGHEVGAALSQTKVLAEAIVPLMSPVPTELAGRHHI